MTTAPPHMHENIRTRRMEPLANDVVTEDYGALLFVERYGENLRYCHTTGSWFVWNGVYWQRDEIGAPYQKARLIGRELGEDQGGSSRKSIGKTSFATGIDKFARSDPQIAVTFEHWDQDPYLLGTPGGVVDLRTGELRAPHQGDCITKVTLVAPLADGCPLWLRFLDEATGNDTALIRFLQQWCGYCLTGQTTEHALLFISGPGGNGKSVWLNIITAILNDYSRAAAMETFTASKTDKHPTDLAMLNGARLVTASETEEGRAWAESRIKQLTGGDPVTARFMRQDFFTFKPQFKLMIVGNHKPVLHNVDDAARRRFNIVPFMFKPKNPDRELEAKLMMEAGGILQWMIDGCLDWQKNGLVRPDSVKAATEAYFSDQDIFGQWIEDCCDVQMGVARTWDKSSDLFDSWSEYAHKAGDAPGTKKSFGQLMQKRGFEQYRVPGQGTRAFRFIRLKIAGARESE